jgi:hypothetical protein
VGAWCGEGGRRDEEVVVGMGVGVEEQGGDKETRRGG